MSFRSVVAKNMVLRVVGVMIVAAAALVSVSRGAQASCLRPFDLTNESFIRAQSPPSAAPPSQVILRHRLQARMPTLRPNFRLPDESAGIDAIVRALISAFDQADIVALGEWHGRIRLDSDLRIALVRHPDFAKKVRSIVVEFGSTTEQSTLDRYIRGETVSRAQLEQVWKTTTQAANGIWDQAIYADFFAAVRDVNSKLPADARIRVFGGDPGPGDNRSRETAAVSVLKEQVLQKHGKALVIYGAAHFYRTMPEDYLSSLGEDIGLARKLEIDFPGRTFVVIPVGRLDRPRAVTADIDPDFQKFDRALKTQVRPVLVSLQRLPFRDFSAEEFLGRTVTTCRGAGGCVSAFKGSTLTLGQMADACIYVGGGADVDSKARGSILVRNVKIAVSSPKFRVSSSVRELETRNLKLETSGLFLILFVQSSAILGAQGARFP